MSVTDTIAWSCDMYRNHVHGNWPKVSPTAPHVVAANIAFQEQVTVTEDNSVPVFQGIQLVGTAEEDEVTPPQGEEAILEDPVEEPADTREEDAMEEALREFPLNENKRHSGRRNKETV